MKKRVLVLFSLVLAVFASFLVKKYFSDIHASHRVKRQVRYSFTLKNSINTVKKNILFQVYAPVKQTATQVVENISSSHAYNLKIDQLGNQILCFDFKEFPPYSTEIIKIQTSLSLSFKPDKVPLRGDMEVFLKPEQYVESDHPDIVLKAKSFQSKSKLQMAKDINTFVINHMSYSGYLQNEQGAYYAFTQKTGDCTEYMDLTTALCRANNIPCKRIAGYVSNKNAVLKPSDYHNWVEIYDGKKWIIADPQKNKFMESSENYIATKIICSSFTNSIQSFDTFCISEDEIKVTMNL